MVVVELAFNAAVVVLLETVVVADAVVVVVELSLCSLTEENSRVVNRSVLCWRMLQC